MICIKVALKDPNPHDTPPAPPKSNILSLPLWRQAPKAKDPKVGLDLSSRAEWSMEYTQTVKPRCPCWTLRTQSSELSNPKTMTVVVMWSGSLKLAQPG